MSESEQDRIERLQWLLMDNDRLRQRLRQQNADLLAKGQEVQDAAIAVIDCWRKFYREETTKKSDVDGFVEELAGKWIAFRAAIAKAKKHEHEHRWELLPVVISTNPPQYTWVCECGAVTHDSESGKLCEIGHGWRGR